MSWFKKALKWIAIICLLVVLVIVSVGILAAYFPAVASVLDIAVIDTSVGAWASTTAALEAISICGATALTITKAALLIAVISGGLYFIMDANDVQEVAPMQSYVPPSSSDQPLKGYLDQPSAAPSTSQEDGSARGDGTGWTDVGTPISPSPSPDPDEPNPTSSSSSGGSGVAIAAAVAVAALLIPLARSNQAGASSPTTTEATN